MEKLAYQIIGKNLSNFFEIGIHIMNIFSSLFSVLFVHGFFDIVKNFNSDHIRFLI